LAHITVRAGNTSLNLEQNSSWTPDNGSKKEGLLFRFVDLHPHFLVQRGDFVNITGMLGDFVIQILYISCSCLKFAVHSDILALERYHGFSSQALMPWRKFIDIDTL
jgi:hypothetical protein